MTERQLRRMYQRCIDANHILIYVAKAYRQGKEDTLTSIKEE